MFTSITLIFLLSFSLIFILLNHPISIGAVILIQTLLISVFTGAQSNNFWFSYILFLVFLGGILILFSYITSLASNQTFKFSSFIFWIILISGICTFLFSFIVKMFNWNFSTLQLFDPSLPTYFVFLHFSKFYLTFRAIITIFIALLLLMTLIVVVTLIKLDKGPLRPLTLH